jgi:hypothetical protein
MPPRFSRENVVTEAVAGVEAGVFFDKVDEALRKVPGLSAVLRSGDDGITKWRLFPNGPVVLVRQVTDSQVKIIRIGLDIPLPKGDRTNLEPMDSTGIDKCVEAIANYLLQTPP